MASRFTYYGDANLVGVIRVGLERDLGRRGRNVETRAKQLCAVDTGRLRSSVRSTVKSDSKGPYAEIGSDVEYAIYVEDPRDTGRSARQRRNAHYLVRGLQAAKD